MSKLKETVDITKVMIRSLSNSNPHLYFATNPEHAYNILQKKYDSAIELARLLCERLEEADQALDTAQKLITMQQELHECDDAIVKLYEMKERKNKGGIL